MSAHVTASSSGVQPLRWGQNAISFNPYRRQPVQDQEMFFGRVQELALIKALLGAESGTIFVQGQKRVGKTSFLFSLKQYYLHCRWVTPVFINFQLLSNLPGLNFYYEIAGALYNNLQHNHPMLASPLRELFNRNPCRQFVNYLKEIQRHLNCNKLVLLIDEFSLTIDACRQNRLDSSFFQQWEDIIRATSPEISYVMVVHPQLHHPSPQKEEALRTSVSRLFQSGETIRLKPFNKKDACSLVKHPAVSRLKHTQNSLNYVWRLTGGSPFLIQAFCFNLVRYMGRTGRYWVELADVVAVQSEFMHPHENVFAHLLDIIQHITHAPSVCHQLAGFLKKTDDVVLLPQLKAALPRISQEELSGTLQKLADHYILVESAPDNWHFAALLFGQWLAANNVWQK